MSKVHFGYFLAAGIALAVTTMVSAGQVAGIARTDGQPLETGPFDSHSTSAGQEIGHQFQSMYLTSQPNLWTKTFRWEIAGNTGLAPGQTLNIMESIPLIYPDNSAGTDGLVKLPISGWHESIIRGDLSDYFQWDSQSRTTSITARIDAEEIPIDAHVSFSSDGKSVWFDFDAIQIPTQGGTSDTPVTLDILKQVQWIGPVLDPLPTSHYIDILVSEFPTTPALAGDYNADGFVDAADYIVWRKGLSTTYIPNDYNVWRANFGQSAGSGSGVRSNAPVPEPATLLQLILVLFWVLVPAVRYFGPSSLAAEHAGFLRDVTYCAKLPPGVLSSRCRVWQGYDSARSVIRRRSKPFLGVDRFWLSKNWCTMADSNVADCAANSNNFFWPLGQNLG